MRVLMASTYPLEVVEAARWSRDNMGVKGQALADANAEAILEPERQVVDRGGADARDDEGQTRLDAATRRRFLAQRIRRHAKLRAEAPAPADAVASGARQPIVIEPVNPNVLLRL
jgi:Protein of unknown function (DUF3300)